MKEESKEILEHSLSLGLYEELVCQLNKDFTRTGLKSEFSKTSSPRSLSRNLIAVIYALIMSDFPKYLSLLYTVDIPETSVSALPEQRVDELAVSVSAMIIKREWQKVIFRKR